MKGSLSILILIFFLLTKASGQPGQQPKVSIVYAPRNDIFQKHATPIIRVESKLKNICGIERAFNAEVWAVEGNRVNLLNKNGFKFCYEIKTIKKGNALSFKLILYELKDGMIESRADDGISFNPDSDEEIEKFQKWIAHLPEEHSRMMNGEKKIEVDILKFDVADSLNRNDQELLRLTKSIPRRIVLELEDKFTKFLKAEFIYEERNDEVYLITGKIISFTSDKVVVELLLHLPTTPGIKLGPQTFLLGTENRYNQSAYNCANRINTRLTSKVR